jgi:von Willebrand factor type A domain
MRYVAFLAVVLASAIGLSPGHLRAAERVPAIDLVLCLDTSNSMDGLLDAAKRNLWSVVNDLAKAKPTPELRVALYSYGHNGYAPESGFVRRDLELTNDLDEAYRKLNEIRVSQIPGGQEYVARVAKSALAGLKWSTDRDALKILFVCGNEAVDQDPQVTLESVSQTAKQQGVILNAIFCGPGNAVEATGWRAFAEQSAGKFANIDQNKLDIPAAVKTPFDDEINALGVKINGTYLAYGAMGGGGAANQSVQDSNALRAAPGVLAERSLTKAGALYKNSAWDLIDRVREDKAFDVTKLKPEELPEELRKLKPDERGEYVKKKALEREGIRKQIAELGEKRAKFIAAEREKAPKSAPKSAGDQAFDEAIRSVLKTQAEGKRIKIEK